MPEAAVLPQPTDLARQMREPHPIAHPLFAGNTVLWYPGGEKREGDGRVCVMLARENHYQVTLLELLPGENRQHKYVRHVNDPFLEVNPRVKQATSGGMGDGGAWDYAQGQCYDFELPRSRSKAAAQAWPFDVTVGEQIKALAQQGKTAGEIAGALAMKGINSEVVSKFLSTQY